VTGERSPSSSSQREADSLAVGSEHALASLRSRGEPTCPEQKGFLRLWAPLLVVAALTVPWLVIRLSGRELADAAVALLSGAAILGAAFLLTWAADVAQLEVSQGLAVAALALVAVLPEYAVDVYFAWMGGKNPAYSHYAVANMTGANRLLIGVGWPVLVLLWTLRTRQKALRVQKMRQIELGYLGLATVWAFVLPLRRELSLLDTAVFLTLFALYVRQTSLGQRLEPELVGPALLIGCLPKGWRRMTVASLFCYSAVVILLSTKAFAEGLLGAGRALGISEFLLVQWVAPLASEAPEFILAALFAVRLQPDIALGTLLSSQVNQWTLLIATLPLTYSLSLAHPAALPLDARQAGEILLTAAQSAFGFIVLAELQLSNLEGFLLFVLFAGQFLSPSVHARYAFSIAYLALFIAWAVASRDHRRGARESVTAALGRAPAGGS
jgi:cation:H+ antiporter